MSFTASDLRRVIWTALFAFIAVFVPLLTGLGGFHDFATAKAAFLSLLPAALAAAFSAIKNALLDEGSTLK
jgi:hypothetical protein